MKNNTPKLQIKTVSKVSKRIELLFKRNTYKKARFFLSIHVKENQISNLTKIKFHNR